MSFANGGRIVTDGLVLSLDASDKNSLSDEPVINLIGTNPTPTSTSGFVFSGPTSYTMSYNATEQAMEFETDNTAVWGWYFYNNSLFNTPLSTSSLHSTSFEWKTGPRNTYTSSLHHQIITGEGTSTSLNTTITTNPSSQTGSYAKLSHTFTPASAGINGNRQYRIIGQAFASGSSRIHLFWRKLQLEQNDHSTTFVSGSRNTWVDLSGNNTNGTFINNPTYISASNGIIRFDGTSSYIDTGKTAAQLGVYDADYTFDAWVYPTDFNPAGNNDRTMFGTIQESVRMGLHLVFRSGNIYQGHYGQDLAAGTGTLNAWNNICYTYRRSSGLASIYKNGIFQGSGIIGSFIGTTNILIGRSLSGSGGPFVGNGSIYKIYNRTLTASEVLQNYNASKSRFNLK
jgi:hypothetical protein